MATERIYVFKLFERFWHWAQAGLIIFMLLTGFEVHGSFDNLGFAKAVSYHTVAAWTLIGLWVFAIFWHLITGEWRQYLPTTQKIVPMMRFYAVGIFKGEPHPFHPTAERKHNPMQRLAYFGVLAFIGPLLWITGWAYLFFDHWREWGLSHVLSLQWVALAHTAGAFMMLAFLVAHLYLITTGHTPGAQLKTMLTGWEESEA